MDPESGASAPRALTAPVDSARVVLDRQRDRAERMLNRARLIVLVLLGIAALVYTPDVVAAVDAFRAGEHLSVPALGSPPGLVDDDTVARLWAALARAGKADSVRQALLETVAVRR